MPPTNVFRIKLAFRDALLEEMRAAREALRTCPKTRMELTLSKELASGHWKSFQDRHEDAVSACVNLNEIGNLMAVKREASAVYVDTMKAIGEEMKLLEEAPLPSLHEIRLRTFAGDWKEWAGWRAIFEDKVLNTGLRVAQKIELLLDALAGKAKEAAGQSEKRDQEELNRIWSKLVETYDNPYQQVYAHIFDMLALPNINTPSSDSYRSMVNKVEENLRLLDRYDVLSNWSALLCVIMLQKVDSHGRYLWNTNFERDPLPNVESLFKFLNSRSRALEDEARSKAIAVLSTLPANLPISVKSPQQSLYPQGDRSRKIISNGPMMYQRPDVKREDTKPYTRSAASQQKPKYCHVCEKFDHPVYLCPTFGSMNVQQRNDTIKKLELCSRCLRAQHNLNDCHYRGVCGRCSSASHNTLLCFEDQVQNVASKIN